MVSIVMTYHNRRAQLIRTLETIRYFGDPEIIIVDDGSDQRIDDLQGIKLIRIDPSTKWYLNPCIAYNIGFSHVTGDKVIIQNAECLHTGDILGYLENLKEGNMFSFGAYSYNHDLTDPSGTLPEFFRQRALKDPHQQQVNHYGWYNHTVYRPVGFHFCNALMRSDIEKIGGFDERFAPGLACDDDEILIRIRRAGIKISIIDDPFVIHQKHERTDYRRYAAERQRNGALLEQVKGESYIKPPQNEYYGK